MHIFYLVNSKQSSNNINNNNNINSNSVAINNNNNNNNSNINSNKNSKDERKFFNYNLNNNDNKVIDQFPHQVGGHSAMLSIEGNICKPLINRELQFYQFTQQKDNIHSFFISPFLAKYYGVIEVLKSKNEEILDNNTNNINNSNNSINIDYNHNSIVNSKNIKKPKDCKHPSGTQQRYIVLEDLTKNYKKPCIVDIKVGTRQRGAICSTTTSTTLGIRVCGMKIFSPEIGNIVFDRYYGRTLNTETLEDSLFNFFTSNIYNNDSKKNNNYKNNKILNLERVKLLDSIIEKLSQIECIISNKNEKFPFKIYSSSLLIIYEGSEDTAIDENTINSNTNCIDINMSQFNVETSHSNSSSCMTTPSQSPTTSLLNISNDSPNQNNIKIQDNINKILRPNSPSNSSGHFRNSGDIFKSMDESSDDTFSPDEDIDESFLSSDMDSDIDETLSNSSHSNYNRGNSTSSSTNSLERKCLKNDIKMIDFAHAIPIDEQDATEDDGYLFGVQNLQLLLFKVKSRIIFNNNSINDNSNHIKDDILDSSSLSSLSQNSLEFGGNGDDFSFLKLYQKELNNNISNINNNTFIPSFY
ncbi:hypothetical protein DICPUDRAFT_150854 [Dictyostelium purpureum]|uniref:Kinase n=1 Tax=Dictyostelium purpureum TaxID=5786 RepID=F0ZHF1_DICPU|nr:uncharacterized protein DICPUDRAFT_150854 [Dictyostelium purpureum]EGC36619.1 hypothetical protein DICPUDRAFT_150854 [Dictyostelium purpureum]|eukprot:XP_003286857.1 hypothetical protein DICPUDRAFT_150854 [Dictyostelium purpureum]